MKFAPIAEKERAETLLKQMILEEKETIGADVLGSYPPIVSNLTSQEANASPNTNDVKTLEEFVSYEDSDDEMVGTPDDEYDRYMKLQIDKKGSVFQLFPNMTMTI